MLLKAIFEIEENDIINHAYILEYHHRMLIRLKFKFVCIQQKTAHTNFENCLYRELHTKIPVVLQQNQRST